MRRRRKHRGTVPADSIQCGRCGRLLPPSVPVCRCGAEVSYQLAGTTSGGGKGAGRSTLSCGGCLSCFGFIGMLFLAFAIIGTIEEKGHIEVDLSQGKISITTKSDRKTSPRRPQAKEVSSKGTIRHLYQGTDRHLTKVVFSQTMSILPRSYEWYQTVMLFVHNERPSLREFLADKVFSKKLKERLFAITCLGWMKSAPLKNFHGRTVDDILLQRLKELASTDQWEELEALIQALALRRSAKAYELVQKIRWRAGALSDFWRNTLYVAYRLPKRRPKRHDFKHFPSSFQRLPWEERMENYALYGLWLSHSGYFREAEKLLRNLPQRVPERYRSAANFCVGKFYMASVWRKRALPFLEKALAEGGHPWEGENHLYLGYLKIYYDPRIRNKAQALQHLNRVSQLEPKRAETYYFRAYSWPSSQYKKMYEDLRRYFVLSYSPTYGGKLQEYLIGQELRELQSPR